MRKPLLDHHRQAEGQQQAQDRIGAIEAAKQQPLDHDADHADEDRRDDERAGKADARRQDDREIGADGVEPAMREIDDAAEREDQREAERDQQIVGADQEAVENLLEDEDDCTRVLPLAGSSGRTRMSGSDAHRSCRCRPSAAR